MDRQSFNKARKRLETVSQLFYRCSRLTITFFILTVALFLTTCKKEKNQTVTVVRDCTGTYLRFDSKDYSVCNPDKVASFSDGTTVTATFRKVDECNYPYTACMMVHPYDIGGLIEVTKIK